VTSRIARTLRKRWRLQAQSLPFVIGNWRYSRRLYPDDPIQGWKIHISATLLSANDVFVRLAPILRAQDVLFKVPGTLEFLARLNSGLSGFSQTGKFITIYARSETEALNLTRQLHARSRHLRGPEIPFDARYRQGSLIYYRYGSFRPDHSNAKGTLVDPAGNVHRDRRAPGHAIPPWLADPFRKVAINFDHAGILGRLGPDYLPFKVIAQRGKGGVYEALDLSAARPRIVIIKEGRRDGETAWNGADGYARVQNETRVLRLLRKAGVPVPEVLRTFIQNGACYLVLEKIVGRQLFSRRALQPRTVSWRRAAKFLERLEPVVGNIHAAGWVWRDCKPSHIFLARGAVRLLDFEGACRIHEREVLTWGSANYLPREYYDSFTRRPGVFEDRHALGVIAFQFGTGGFPPPDTRARWRLYKRTNCPERLREKIEALLGRAISRREISTAAQVAARK
jgi:hypothetical protein